MYTYVFGISMLAVSMILHGFLFSFHYTDTCIVHVITGLNYNISYHELSPVFSEAVFSGVRLD